MAAQIEVAGLVAGSSYDRLQITGVASIAGRLDVPVINNFISTRWKRDYLLTCRLHFQGAFDSLSSPNLLTAGNGLAIELSNTATDMKLKFVAATTNNFQGTAAQSNWTDLPNWSAGAAPRAAI